MNAQVMTGVAPLHGIHFNPAHIHFGGVLAPPYDVINTAAQQELYARDLRNITRIDFGMRYPDDVDSVNDCYTRARGHLDAWLKLGILVRCERPGYYVTAHEFTMPDGTPRRRLGLFATVAALPWESSLLRPHERTLRGPKEDRLRLMRATATQTSAVFGVWDREDGLDAVFAEICAAPALLGGRTEGELGSEKHLLWLVEGDQHVAAIGAALAASRLYVADGHHRYETAVAYAAERREQHPAIGADDDSQRCLVYLCAADDPGMAVLPTHRLIRPRSGLPKNAEQLRQQLGAGIEVVEVDDLATAVRAAGLRRSQYHAYAVALSEGSVLLVRRRDSAETSPRARLDVVVLEAILLRPLGLDDAAIAEGALGYTRQVDDVAAAVASGEAGVGVVLQPLDVSEVMAVADAAEVMPQKSTYFYPKVPTGVVLAPL